VTTHNRATRKELDALVERLAPAGRLVRSRRLRGGLGARMDVLDIELADGSHWKVTLRRFVRNHRSSTPERVAHEYRVLQLVESAAVPAPRPLLLDADGAFFGVPAIVLTYLPGRPAFPGANLAPWTAGLAQALRLVHAVTPASHDLSWLEIEGREQVLAALAEDSEAAPTDPLVQEVLSILLSSLDDIDFSESTLIHSDYWPGNTVWSRGRLSGIVDWTSASRGDPRADVAQCRIDLTFTHGAQAADAFASDYERLAGHRLPDLWFFDLLRGTGALLEYEHWLEGYHDAGLRHLQPADVAARLRVFMRRAIEDGRHKTTSR
jgi:aminoglycoside phosphotransferase (APT) family kinase protein